MERALFSSDTEDHYTPHHIASAARDVLNGIALDPASCETANQTIQATRYYTEEDNGLAQPWYGSLWLNPPFSVAAKDALGNPIISEKTGKEKRLRVINQWVERWVRGAVQGQFTSILLVPVRTDTVWFRPLFQFPMCFVNGRLRFGDAKAGAPFPTVLVYVGPHVGRFYKRFAEVGQVGRLAETFQKEATVC